MKNRTSYSRRAFLGAAGSAAAVFWLLTRESDVRGEQADRSAGAAPVATASGAGAALGVLGLSDGVIMTVLIACDVTSSTVDTTTWTLRMQLGAVHPIGWFLTAVCLNG